MAISCEPDLIVLDEPTTGLDVTTQEQIIGLLIQLRHRVGTSMLYVTHDLGVLSQIADRIGVMYAGKLVEIALTQKLFEQPAHPYTRGLINSIPRIDSSQDSRGPPLKGIFRRSQLPAGCPFQPRCDYAMPSCRDTPQVQEQITEDHVVVCQRWRELPVAAALQSERHEEKRTAGLFQDLLSVNELTLAYGTGGGVLRSNGKTSGISVVRDLSLSIGRGEILGLVGESGSGKSTVARAISGLLTPVSGEIKLEGMALEKLVKDRPREQRRKIQYIFQNPDASLNPRARIGGILARPLSVFFNAKSSAIATGVMEALTKAQLDVEYAGRFPDQLSGGERQRVAIARALIASPDLLICDEVLSALDVSIQASIIELLGNLREELGVAMLFISHDLAVVRHLADRVAVMYGGELMEIGSTEQVFSPPYHPYTFRLLKAVPRLGVKSLSPSRADRSRVEKRDGMGKACAFAGRCPWQIGKQCEDVPPPWQEIGPDSGLRCHLSIQELMQRSHAIDDSTCGPQARSTGT
jgi:peptide/nickel transport system ATP-binding protein